MMDDTRADLLQMDVSLKSHLTVSILVLFHFMAYIFFFLSELYDLDVWETDIGNAYLEVEMQEKVYIIVGPEFNDLEGHILIIFNALYGLKTSSLCWHECFAWIPSMQGRT